MFDDVNIARAIGVLNEAVGRYGGDAADGASAAGGDPPRELETLRTMLYTVGVAGLDREAASAVDESYIEMKIDERNAARAARDWATSDRIRDELAAAGVALKDGPEGTTWKRVIKAGDGG